MEEMEDLEGLWEIPVPMVLLERLFLVDMELLDIEVQANVEKLVAAVVAEDMVAMVEMAVKVVMEVLVQMAEIVVGELQKTLKMQGM